MSKSRSILCVCVCVQVCVCESECMCVCGWKGGMVESGSDVLPSRGYKDS